MFRASVIRNRNRFTGRFVPGCTLVNSEGHWIGPGLGHFRNTAQARAWAAKNGYVV